MDGPNVRPQAARMTTDIEESPLDKTWGRLFDVDGRATPRLGQFLRGLANHIVCVPVKWLDAPRPWLIGLPDQRL